MMIEKAIIPAAGLGKRLRPLTESTPKELLLAAGKPLIHHAVQELLDAGIQEICVVIREGKEAIADYFKGEETRLQFVYQEKLLGLGDAMLTARDFAGESPFLMLIPDQLLISETPATKQLREAYDFSEPTVLSSMVKIPASETGYFPGARGFEYKKNRHGELLEIDSILSEDEADDISGESEFRTRGFGRTIFPPQIFEYLTEEYINPATGEVDLLKTFQAFRGRLAHYGLLIEGRPCDFGTLKGYKYYNDILHDGIK